jgi:uncharacterized protein (DUF362 family)
MPAVYPSGETGFSPADSNPIYAAVGRCLAGRDAANPLGKFIRPGMRVFILCNFVQHRMPGESQLEFQAKCTHASVLRPIIDFVLTALGDEGTVAFGNAPIQGASWDALMRDTGCADLLAYYDRHAPGRVRAMDLRGTVLEDSRLVFRRARGERDRGVLLDLGEDSLLEGVRGHRQFRGIQYSANEMADYHGPGKHVYALSSTVAQSDVLISVPKLKTHEKVGVTLALKGTVGTTALKECLAHHRRGPTSHGGDEFAHRNPLLMMLSAISDRAWNSEGRLADGLRQSERVLGSLMRRSGSTVFGSWAGNDTCWRMALDIARCAVYGTVGGLESQMQRKHLVFVDGVIAGEGQGPLHPTPRPLGWLSFATDPFASDWVATHAMGFDPARIAVVREALSLSRYPLTSLDPDDVSVVLDGQPVALRNVAALLHQPLAEPRGWKGSLRWTRS